MNNLTKRQQEIIQVSIELIASGGIQNLTIKNIAAKLSVSEPAIYRHFKSKLEILSSTLDFFEASFDKTVEKIEESEFSNFTKLKNFFLLRCQEFYNNPNLAKLIFSEEIFQNENVLSEKVLNVMKKNQLYIYKLLLLSVKNSEIRNDIPIDHISTIILGALRLLVTRWRLSSQSFNLSEMAIKLWCSIEIMIIKEN